MKQLWLPLLHTCFLFGRNILDSYHEEERIWAQHTCIPIAQGWALRLSWPQRSHWAKHCVVMSDTDKYCSPPQKQISGLVSQGEAWTCFLQWWKHWLPTLPFAKCPHLLLSTPFPLGSRRRGCFYSLILGILPIYPLQKEPQMTNLLT